MLNEKEHRVKILLNPNSKPTRFFVTLVIALTLVLFLEQKYLQFTKGLEFDIQDRLMRWKNRNHAVASEEIALIWVDDATIKKYGGAPPPREVEAKLVKVLHQNGAKAIAFDFTFDMERNGTEDLTQVGEKINALIYGVALNEVDKNRDNLPPPLPRLTPFKINEQNQTPEDNYILERIPCQELIQYVKHLGHIMFRVSLDGAIRHIPLIVKIGNRYYPALSLIAVCLLKDVPLDGSGVTVKWGKYILLEDKKGWMG